MNDRIAEFLATVNSPDNLKSAREKLDEAVELLQEVQELLPTEGKTDAET